MLLKSQSARPLQLFSPSISKNAAILAFAGVVFHDAFILKGAPIALTAFPVSPDIADHMPAARAKFERHIAR
jgi:hypothetical protein